MARTTKTTDSSTIVTPDESRRSMPVVTRPQLMHEQGRIAKRRVGP
jgi:hypothetical protein